MSISFAWFNSLFDRIYLQMAPQGQNSQAAARYGSECRYLSLQTRIVKVEFTSTQVCLSTLNRRLRLSVWSAKLRSVRELRTESGNDRSRNTQRDGNRNERRADRTARSNRRC